MFVNVVTVFQLNTAVVCVLRRAKEAFWGPPTRGAKGGPRRPNIKELNKYFPVVLVQFGTSSRVMRHPLYVASHLIIILVWSH